MRRIPLLIGLAICASLCSYVCSFDLFAQNAGLLRTDLISPSPTASQLAKYGDIPVTYYTGSPNVSIPIFNVTGNELTLPISLTYNYNGAQPGQKASWAGLGWSVQAGGVITRSVGDRLDGAYGFDIDSVQLTPSQDYLKRARYHGLTDNLPDVYNFNFGSYSGKFIYEHGNYYIMPKQKIKISGNGYGQFVITAEDGTKYYFNALEYSTSKPGASGYNIPQHVSAWYLTRISNATDTESIYLSYAQDGTMEQFGVRMQTYRQPINIISPPVNPASPEDVLPTRVSIQRLAVIYSDKYKVEFLPGAPREDVTMISGTTYSLGAIRVSSKDLQLKYFSFAYDYTPNPGKALRLKSLTETTPAGPSKHTFNYYNSNQSIGSGLSSSVDKFGYLLAGENRMLISNEIHPLGVDRTPFFNTTINGTLQSITYPTGGTTTFTYEPNRYNTGDKNIINHLSGGRPAIRYDSTTSNQIYGIDTFNVTHAQYVNLFFTRLDKNGPYDPLVDPTEVRHDNVHEVEIRRVYPTYDEEGNLLYETLGSAIYQGKIINNSDNDGFADSVSLSPGKYIVKTICDQHELEVTVAIFFDFDTGVKSPGVLGPGVRLKELVHDNGFGKTITKKFSYVKVNGHSAGELLRSDTYQVTFMNDITHDLDRFSAVISDIEYKVYTSFLAERGDVGLPLYYKRVIEDTESGEEIHRTIYDYNFFFGTDNAELMAKTEYVHLHDTVFVPSVKDEFTFSQEFGYEGVGGLEIYTRENHMNVSSSGTYPGYEIYDFNVKTWAEYWKHSSISKQTKYENGQLRTVQTTSYYDPQGTRNLLATKTINQNGSTIYTKYKYPEDYSGLSELTALTAANILSPVIEEQVWYHEAGSLDSILISGRINEYQNLRVKAVYIHEAASDVKTLSNETTTTVGDVKKYTSLLSNSSYKKKIEFVYDNNGRITAQKLTDQPIVSYVWGYPGYSESGSSGKRYAHPIAEIKNALATSVFYTSFEDASNATNLTDGSGNPIASVSGVKCKADSFKIKQTFTGSYTLTYWKKTGSNPWILISQTLANPSNYIINASGSYIDEVRLYPVDAQMTTYTYYSGLGISQIIDINNRISKFEYDEAGRLKTVRDQAGNITNTYQYHIKDDSEN